jgi:alpha-mannosidase
MKLFTIICWIVFYIPHIRSWSSNEKDADLGSVRKLAATLAPQVLNVHVVPHTHDDVGWRKTVEQYYYGLNQTMERCGAVHAILSTTVAALTEHAARTFTYVEMKFFSMWWYNQTAAMQDTVRFLVANRQLTIANGGWCMHDEAATHYMGMIDQTTLGHQFLLRELGVRPQTGWQLDPFGHSATQAKLLTYAAGMDALYFGRIDYQDLALRRNESRCEGLWRPSNDSTVFWGLTGSYGGNYNPPPGFCFDLLCDDEPLVGANTTRLFERVLDFLREINVQSDQTRDNNIMLTFGEDFTVCFMFRLV